MGSALVYALLPTVSHGATMRVASTYVLNEDQASPDDLYLVSEDIWLNGTTTGDAFLVAGKALVVGPVTDDLFFGGGEIAIGGLVGGDARLVGGTLTVTGTVEEDLLSVGGAVILDDESLVKGNVLLYADHVELFGAVTGDVEVYARNIILRGTIEGSALIHAEESFSMQGEAAILGDLAYEAPSEVIRSENATIGGEVSFEQRIREADSGFSWNLFMFRILASAFAGLLLLLLFPAFSSHAAHRALSNNGSLILLGLAVLVLTPIIAFVLMATILGIVPGLVVLMAYGSALLVAAALTPVLAGGALAKWLKKEDTLRWYWITLGAAALIVVGIVPVLGVLVRALFYLTALGTLAALLHEHIWKKRKSEPSMEPPVADDPDTEPEALEASTDEHHAEDTTPEEQEKSEPAS
jgi:cytoskeletal protein CcmA (bactofilin family)